MTDSALRFNKGTELNQSFQKSIVVRDYGQGVIEVGFSSVPSPNSREVDRRRHEQQAEFVQFQRQSPVNLDRSLRRTKATVRRKCMAAGLNYLLTLTYRENVIDSERAQADLTRFLRLVRVRMPDYKYVCVREYQERGAVHFHLAVKGFQQVALLRSIWWSIVGEGMGNIDVSEPKFKNKSSLWNLAKLAGYISKYITKASCEAFGRQRYSVAEGIEIPRSQTTVWFPAGVDMLQEIFDSLGAEIAYRFEAKEGYGWASSW